MINNQSNKVTALNENQKNQDLFFIVGRGRSGTSLLQTILNQNHQIAIAPEAQFIMYLWKRYHNKGKLDISAKENFIKDLWKEKRLQNWNLDAEALETFILNLAPEKSTFPELCKQVYIQYAKSLNKKKGFICGDKNPHYALFINRLMVVYPKAKFIYLIRDPRPNILSYQNVDFDLQSLPALAKRWNLYNKAVLKQAEKFSEKFLCVKFEDLLQSPKEELQKICQFLGVSYHPEMLEFYKKEQEWKTSFRRNLSTPLDPSKIDSWRKKMTREDATKVETICAQLMDRFKYPKSKVKHRSKLGIRDYLSIQYAVLVTFLEKIIYYFPIEYFKRFIDLYRKQTKTY